MIATPKSTSEHLRSQPGLYDDSNLSTVEGWERRVAYEATFGPCHWQDNYRCPECEIDGIALPHLLCHLTKTHNYDQMALAQYCEIFGF